jgi:hypothetical protein
MATEVLVEYLKITKGIAASDSGTLFDHDDVMREMDALVDLAFPKDNSLIEPWNTNPDLDCSTQDTEV